MKLVEAGCRGSAHKDALCSSFLNAFSIFFAVELLLAKKAAAVVRKTTGVSKGRFWRLEGKGIRSGFFNISRFHFDFLNVVTNVLTGRPFASFTFPLVRKSFSHENVHTSRNKKKSKFKKWEFRKSCKICKFDDLHKTSRKN